MLLHISRRVLRVLNTSKVLTARERQKHITATNVAKVLGLDRYVSGNELLAAKLRVIDARKEMSREAKLGVELERAVLDAHAKAHRLFLTPSVADNFALHDIHEGIAAALDGLSWCGKCIEIKTVRRLPARPDVTHVCQVLFILEVTGLDEAHLVYAEREDTEKRVVFRFKADRILQQMIMDKMLQFRDLLNELEEKSLV